MYLRSLTIGKENENKHKEYKYNERELRKEPVNTWWQGERGWKKRDRKRESRQAVTRDPNATNTFCLAWKSDFQIENFSR